MNQPLHLFVTGATGFVGSAVCTEADARGHHVRGAVRTSAPESVDFDSVAIGTIGPDTDWRVALQEIDVVIHLAARVHVMKDDIADPLTEFRFTNAQATLQLARQAAAAGVKRFIFVSSVKAAGEESTLGKPLCADDEPAPRDAYGISKMEAEQGLLVIAAATAMSVVIIRPPLVYGPGVKANFASMMRWLSRGVPLPFGAIYNRRSLVALDNLVDLIMLCCHHPAAANQIFMVSDGEDLSTTELLQRMSLALGQPARLIPLPANWLCTVATLFGKANVVNRLCGSLQVDITKTRQLLGWTPPVTVDEALRRTAQG